MEKGRPRDAGWVLVGADSETGRRQAQAGGRHAAKGPGRGRDKARAAEGAVWAALAVADLVEAAEQTKRRRREASMPRRDGTGPMGMGPKTGRAAGFCAGFEMPGYMNQGPGRGLGMGFGCGRGRGRGAGGGGHGWRNMFYATGLPGWVRSGEPVTVPPAQELAVLKQQAEQFGHALEDISKRIQELESQPANK